MGQENGRVLTTTKCMAPKEACLHHCRFPSDRPTGKTRLWNGAHWEEGSGPEIDAREKSINDLQTKRIQA